MDNGEHPAVPEALGTSVAIPAVEQNLDDGNQTDDEVTFGVSRKTLTKVVELFIENLIGEMQKSVKKLLSEEAAVTRCVRVEKKRGIIAFKVRQAIAVVRYFQLLMEGDSKMISSTKVATATYGKRSPSSFKARILRYWADVYLVPSELVKFQQGVNTITKSLLHHWTAILNFQVTE